MSIVTIVTPFDHAVIVDGQAMPDDVDPFAAFANALADRIESSVAAVLFTDPAAACAVCQDMGTTWCDQTGDAVVCRCEAGDRAALRLPWLRRLVA